MNTLLLLLLSPVGELVLRWTVLLSIAWVADALMRRGHPRRRLILWRAVLVLGCVVPVADVLPKKVFRIGNNAPNAHFEGYEVPYDLSPKFTAPRPPAVESPQHLFSQKAIFEAVWLVGMAVGVIRLILTQARLSRLRKNASGASSELLLLAKDVQTRLHIGRTVAIRTSDGVCSPLVCGLLSPTIILPTDLVRSPVPNQISALLSHEMAHVRSHDLLWSVIWRWIKVVAWPHPLVWGAPAAHNLACEQEADRIASDLWEDRSMYVRALAQLTLRVLKMPSFDGTLALGGASQIVRRLALLQLDRFRSWRRRDSLVGVALVAGLALAAAGWGFSIARAETPSDESAHRLVEQQQPRKVVPFDPKSFDKYVGFYQLAPRLFFTITREGDHFFSQLTGQQKFEVFPESPTKFFYTVVAAQISFETDAAGNVVELVLHQNGREQHALRVDESVTKDNSPDADREPPLHRYVEALAKGQADLDDMAPGLIDATKSQWPQIQKSTEGLGPCKSLVYSGVGPFGMDAYIGTFENKEMKFFIGPLNADHKMQGLLMIPWNAALEKRVKDNVADFDREPPLRRYAEALASGQADVAEMTPELGAATKSQWPQIQKMIEGLGGLKSLVFQNVDSMGWDVYMATFEKGKLTLLIGPLNADHKMEGLMMRP